MNDIIASNCDIFWIGRKECSDSGRVYGPGVIKLPEKEVWIELKNGTRYICATHRGCRIDWTNFVIIEGTIEAYHNASC